MTATTPRKPGKIPPKWAIAAFLLGALCAFGAAAMAFSQNGPGAIKFALAALLLYVAGLIGYALAPKRPPADPKPERVS
jgi:hypothetical protein